MEDSTITPGNPGQARENWGDKRAKLKVKFTTLTDSDLRYQKGKKDEMLERIQTRLGKTRKELDTIIAEL